MEVPYSMDTEAASSSLSATDQPKRGGWVTFPFIMVATFGTVLANQGWVSNLIVYLISEYRVKNIDAAQISNLVNAFTFFIPVVAAIVADSFLGCFSVIWISSLISLLGTVILFITTFLDSSTSQPCENGSPDACNSPSKLKNALLYTGIVLGTIGAGGTRSTLSNMGADQLNNPKNQSIFFNWFFFSLYTAQVIGTTVIVYVEDNVSWSWGFGLCVGANVIGLAVFLFGSRFYQYVKPEGSPFTGIARVFIATIRKRKVLISTESKDFYYGNDHGEMSMMVVSSPTKSFKFLNRAAYKTEGDTNSDGSVANPWKLCSVQQVEDLKSVIRILPLWSSSIWLGTPIGVQLALAVLQALTMDRHIGRHFQVPPASVIVFVLIATAICLILFDRVIFPSFTYFLGRPLTPLQRIGIGQVLNVAAMAISALVESKRLNVAKSRHIDGNAPKGNSIVPISVLWLVPQLAVVGMGEAFHYPGQVGLYYQEFPKELKNMATAMISLLVAVAFYLSTAVIDVFRRVTTWLPDDLNQGRLDLVYWVLFIFGVLNFGYYLVCSWFYKYQNVVIVPHENSTSVNKSLD